MSLDSEGWDRRSFLRMLGLGATAVAAVPTRAATRTEGHAPGGRIPAPVGGDNQPYPIPWLDKNGSHNQPAGPGNEPSSIYHFKGRVARSASFTGSGVAGSGERLLFGTETTDNSYMQGECWTSQRRTIRATWAHL